MQHRQVEEPSVEIQLKKNEEKRSVGVATYEQKFSWVIMFYCEAEDTDMDMTSLATCSAFHYLSNKAR